MRIKHHLTKFTSILLAAVLLTGTFTLTACGSHTADMPGRSYTWDSISRTKELYMGDEPITTLLVSGQNGCGDAVKTLLRLARSAGFDSVTVKSGKRSSDDENAAAIVCRTDRSLPKNTGRIYFEDGTAYIVGSDKKETERQAYYFANTYLGYSFAGSEDEHLTEGICSVTWPTSSCDESNAYMEEREPIICLWRTTTAHGNYYNTNTSLLCELMSYSDDQLYTYVRMMKVIGYTGIQVTDMCSTWAAYGGYEFVQQRIRFMADAAHSMGMNFTLWVWGSEFTGYGWTDDSVEYCDYTISEFAYDNPEAVAAFDKYYSIYALLADCCDRVIVHYNDPGNIPDSEDIVYFAGMLRDKFLAVNPDIDFGINCYTDQINKPLIAERLGTDVTVYEGVAKTDDADLTGFRVQTQSEGLRLGVWSWNLTEMEIDQYAEMNVNVRLIQDAYLRTAQYDIYMKPTYWSEMDSYHLLNIASMYASASLLISPNEDPDELLVRAAAGLVGERYAQDFADILSLIQDARTGDDWNSFRWESDSFVMKSDSYNAALIEARCDTAIENLNRMIDENPEGGYIPLPISVTEYLGLILPHVMQIREFARFRILLDEAQQQILEGADKQAVRDELEANLVPVADYNTITGIWGGAELRTQFFMLEDFCSEYGLEMITNDVVDYYRMQRMYQEFCTLQKKEPNKKLFTWDQFELGIAFGEAETKRILGRLCELGLMVEEADGEYSIREWESIRYAVQFN